jgi:hypothetical protein
MRCRLTPLRVRVALALTLAGLPGLALVHARDGDKPPAASKQAWTSDEALAQLALYPHDPYLQYVALQLARREGTLGAAGEQVAQIVDPAADRRARGAARRESVDLFSIFTGALAVQESLQLDTLRGRGPEERKDEAAENRRKEIIDVANLKGPTIKSHPWETMLAGRKPDVGTLAKMVPEDCYFVEFRSANKMLELLDAGDLWVRHLSNQATREARSQLVGERVRRQLVIETNRLLRPVYDAVVEEVAFTGGDLFLAEGSDVTLLFRARQPEILRERMDGFLANAAKARPDAKRTEDEYLGVRYVHLTTPERDLHVFSAYPEEGLHVRSNSKAAFFRVLEAIKGKSQAGKEVRRLGDTPEFAYIRTLMPRGAREEDGFVYLSDPFIRRLVGPEVKLTERRRVLCYNHLRMIGHAALLFRTEHGRAPKSLAELTQAKCTPGAFNEGDLACPDGGKYALSADGLQGVCTHHGRAGNLVPCCETPLAWVTGLEADEYKAFLDEYNSYWRTFFDPIAIRLQVTPQRYRLETIVLPLIDNSIYTGLARAFNGKPEALDALPVPRRNIFTAAGRFPKEELLQLLPPDPEAAAEGEPAPAPWDKSLTGPVNSLKQIGLAMHNYHDSYAHFPTAAGRDKAGKPLLSWRVHLLPYLEQDALYREFKLDEPWDSDHNKKLIARMPKVYQGRNPKLTEAGKTPFLVPVGPGTLFGDDKKPLRFADITDGTSNTILAVEADDERAVVWTKPDDFTVDPKDPRKGLARPGQDGFLALMADGSPHYFLATIDPRTLTALFTPAGGEVVDLKRSDERPLRDTVAVGRGPRGPLGGLPEEILGRLKVHRFLKEGLGNQVGLNVYDAPPLFDFDLPQFLGMMTGTLDGRGRGREPNWETVGISFLISSLNAPVYLSLPVKDVKVVDEFLNQLDEVLPVLARERENIAPGIGFEQDFYKTKLGSGATMRAYALRFGPVKWRLFWGRVGNGLYIASKPFILEDLAAAEEARAKEPDRKEAPDPDATGHATVRLRPRNWNQVLADYRLGWAENNRQACLANLGPLSSVGRAAAAQATAAKEGADGKADVMKEVARLAEQLYAVHFFCPEGGRYELSADGKACTCSVHGSAQSPRQAMAPNATTGPAKLLQDFGGLTATLTFLEDGLHAVVVLERK